MHFAFTDEQAMIAETARGFFAGAATSERTRAAMAGGGIDRALWTAFAGEMGLAGVALPEAYGGSGLGMVEAAIVAEAAGALVAALPFLASSLLAGSAIAAGGSETQRETYLPAIASGTRIASFVEMGASGEGLAPHGAVADLFVVAIGGGVVIVDAADVAVEALPTMDATRPLARVRLGSAAIEPLDPVPALRAARSRGAVALAADSLGGAQALLDRTVAFAQDRVQFGRPIGSFQAVKHRLADMMVAIEQARSAVYWAACAIDEGSPDVALAVHSAKAFACDAYFDCAAAAIQLHGGIGFTWEHDAHLFFKRAQANRTLLGTPDQHREAVAALMLPRAA
ncbi:acyl-CoA dehydrogenase family protein [Sphingoaurantiacus capsulatus]|uniref:Acyl-CoA dehydrogenase family protein n=1 Tax=Sphingoaurantiacus capsulatus TaxID=1771310 RepID=A0ABV7X7Z9_9SPHN